MERLIVIYRTGSYDTYSEQHIPVEYISASEFILDLELSILYYTENHERVENEIYLLGQQFYKMDGSMEENSKILEQQDELRRQLYIRVGNIVLDTAPYDNISIDDFEVLTIDEFFVNYAPETYKDFE